MSDERGRYYTAEITFWAASQEDAEDALDRMTCAYCQGTGEGDEHECANPNWVASLIHEAFDLWAGTTRDHTEHRAAAGSREGRQ